LGLHETIYFVAVRQVSWVLNDTKTLLQRCLLPHPAGKLYSACQFPRENLMGRCAAGEEENGT